MDFEEDPEMEELLDEDVFELDEETRRQVQLYKSRKMQARRDARREDTDGEQDPNGEERTAKRKGHSPAASKEAPPPTEIDRYRGDRKIKEVVSSRKSGRKISRRGFLSTFSLGWMGAMAALGTGTVGSVRAFFPNVLSNPPEKFTAGKPEDYATGEVSARYKDQYRVWIVHLGNRLVSILAICTHLGCTPNWLDSDEIYKCPCHGSAYYKNGVNFAGPAPRPMDRVAIRLNAQGKIEVDKSKIFRYSSSPGWDAKEAYIKV